MILFTCATLAPIAMILLSAAVGGLWPIATLLYMTVLTFALDRMIAAAPAEVDSSAEFPGAPRLLAVLGAVHFVVLTVAVWAVAGQSGLGGGQRICLGIAAGMVFGQIAHPVAHELIHKRARTLRIMGRAVYTSLLVGHHASAHLLVHHVHVGSSGDPNSAAKGIGFYRFAMRAGWGGFVAGLRAETAMLRRARRPVWRHPYVLYVLGGIACILLAAALAGLWGVAAYIAMCLYAQMQILMSDYVQHYGLRRRTLPSGGLEPVGPAHSWNAPHRFSSALTLNAPRHSDHHIAPATPYPALRLTRGDMPCLPYPLPMMAALSLAPSLWRRVMDRRVDRWTASGPDS
ncbi:alkane 1-monooxygenase [Roseovarius sp. Pro17]|uniref:alkane 1-monooxygenase n=1 Tax=Roseovarius sp. Pro17 TaxID=3108175 RepID=UPI002D7A1A2E|nr:alkane 1-monooxygenase [Roseovarius sp. Pro17]